MVSEDIVIPSCANREVVELDVVFDDVLVILHLQIVDTVFCISSRIDGVELGVECLDEDRPVVQPVRYCFGVIDRWF